MSAILVQRAEQLTTEWAEAVLKQHDRNASVTSLEILSQQIGTTTRIRLAVQHNSPQLPERWFVKLPSKNWRARLITALPRLLQTEVRFYQQLAAKVPVPLPFCLAAESSFGHGTVLVLEDITERGGKVGAAGDRLESGAVFQAVEQLAAMHGRFWQDRGLSREHPWLADSIRRVEDLLGTILAAPLMRRGLAKAATVIPEQLHAAAMNYAANRKRAMAFLGDAPWTLTHHDCHPGNIFFSQDGELGLLDWQLVRLGDGIGDLSYLLCCTLAPEERSRLEPELLSHYAACLKKAGIMLDEGELLLRYRAHCCYCLEAMVVTLAIGGMMPLEENLELIRRGAAAVQQLDSYAAIPGLTC